MLRFAITGLAAVALVASSRDNARAGSIHSPITKAEAREARILLYEHETSLRDANPAGFDHKHPVLGNLLAGEAGLGRFLSTHHFHHGLLCVHDPFIWRVVEGDILYHKLHPFSNPSSPPFTGPTPPIDSVPGGDPPGGGGPNPGPPPRRQFSHLQRS